uniref:Uncharacterized protein n=1 Tax=Arundo donax TaxID=35708 RepID=A0A0A8YLB7_ARUDO
MLLRCRHLSRVCSSAAAALEIARVPTTAISWSTPSSSPKRGSRHRRPRRAQACRFFSMRPSAPSSPEAGRTRSLDLSMPSPELEPAAGTTVAVHRARPRRRMGQCRKFSKVQPTAGSTDVADRGQARHPSTLLLTTHGKSFCCSSQMFLIDDALVIGLSTIIYMFD